MQCYVVNPGIPYVFTANSARNPDGRIEAEMNYFHGLGKAGFWVGKAGFRRSRVGFGVRRDGAAVKAAVNPRREKEVQSPDPRREKENQATRQPLRIRSNTIQVHLSGINKKRDHGPIMVQGWRPGGTRCRPGNQVRLLRSG